MNRENTIYIWKPTPSVLPHIHVLPPYSGGEWGHWLSTQDASLRRFTPCDGEVEGYWTFDISMKKGIYLLCMKLHLSIESTEPTHLLQNTEGALPAYQVLYILPTAPKAVVDASYRALQKLHHPDYGGSEEESKKINDAKERIYRENEW